MARDLVESRLWSTVEGPIRGYRNRGNGGRRNPNNLWVVEERGLSDPLSLTISALGEALTSWLRVVVILVMRGAADRPEVESLHMKGQEGS